jgi:hypothetical protein
MPALKNLIHAPRDNHLIRKANCGMRCSPGYFSVTPSPENSNACTRVYFVGRITAHLRIKSFAFGFPVLFHSILIMMLALLLFLCPTANAQVQKCEQMMLGLQRQTLASASLPSGLVFFAGGLAGASRILVCANLTVTRADCDDVIDRRPACCRYCFVMLVLSRAR